MHARFDARGECSSAGGVVLARACPRSGASEPHIAAHARALLWRQASAISAHRARAGGDELAGAGGAPDHALKTLVVLGGDVKVNGVAFSSSVSRDMARNSPACLMLGTRRSAFRLSRSFKGAGHAYDGRRTRAIRSTSSRKPTFLVLVYGVVAALCQRYVYWPARVRARKCRRQHPQPSPHGHGPRAPGVAPVEARSCRKARCSAGRSFHVVDGGCASSITLRLGGTESTLRFRHHFRRGLTPLRSTSTRHTCRCSSTATRSVKGRSSARCGALALAHQRRLDRGLGHRLLSRRHRLPRSVRGSTEPSTVSRSTCPANRSSTPKPKVGTRSPPSNGECWCAVAPIGATATRGPEGVDEEAIELLGMARPGTDTACACRHAARRVCAAHRSRRRERGGVDDHDVGVEEGGGVDGIDAPPPDVPASSSPRTSTTITPFARDTWDL